MGRISKLHEYTLNKINGKFPHLHVQENAYPDWLLSPIGTRLELDVFIEELNIAAEIQGDQHSFFVPFFHRTIENFDKQKEYDEHKQYVCRQNGIKLYDIATQGDADVMVYEIKELLDALDTNRPKYYYQEEQRQTPSAIRKRNKRMNPSKIDNSEAERIVRINKCKSKLFEFESGIIQAGAEKVEQWRTVIDNNGFAE